jgi:putative tributyrin esterase
MALFTLNFESQYLNGNTEVGVIMPDKPRTTNPKDFYLNGEKYKVLWLLHGTFGDYSDWIRKSMIELYACENDLVVVMPSALNSDYTNWDKFANGYGMYDYFINELMPLIYGWFPVSTKREDNFIAGLSMGGGGTFKFALTNPEKFAGAAILSSSPFNYETYLKEADPAHLERTKNKIANHGTLEDFLASDDNTWRLFQEKVGTDLPKMYFSIGEDDAGFERFQAFRKKAEEIGFEGVFETIPGYKHEWRIWDITIQHALEYFGFNSREKGNAF